MQQPTIWHGTEQETQLLLTALERNCRGEGDGAHCVYAPTGARTSTCEAHGMLLAQRVLDGLVFMRRSAATLVEREWQR